MVSVGMTDPAGVGSCSGLLTVLHRITMVCKMYESLNSSKACWCESHVSDCLILVLGSDLPIPTGSLVPLAPWPTLGQKLLQSFFRWLTGSWVQVYSWSLYKIFSFTTEIEVYFFLSVLSNVWKIIIIFDAKQQRKQIVGIYKSVVKCENILMLKNVKYEGTSFFQINSICIWLKTALKNTPNRRMKRKRDNNKKNYDWLV